MPYLCDGRPGQADFWSLIGGSRIGGYGHDHIPIVTAFTDYTRATAVPDCLFALASPKTGLTKHEGPPGCLPGDPRAVRYDTWPMSLDVVAPPLHVNQKPGESRPVHDVSPALGTLAVAHRGDAGQVAGDLAASSVVGTEAGLAPDRSRQVGH